MQYISLSSLTNHRSVKEVFVASETEPAVAQLGKAGSSLLKTSWTMLIAVMSLGVNSAHSNDSRQHLCGWFASTHNVLPETGAVSEDTNQCMRHDTQDLK